MRSASSSRLPCSYSCARANNSAHGTEACAASAPARFARAGPAAMPSVGLATGSPETSRSVKCIAQAGDHRLQDGDHRFQLLAVVPVAIARIVVEFLGHLRIAGRAGI